MAVAFLRKNSREFNERYTGTYGVLQHKDKKLVVLVDAVAHGVCQLSDKHGITYKVNMVEDSPEAVFHFLLPKTGWVNTAVGPLRVARVPARQFKFGVCSNNTTINDVNGVPVAVNHQNVEALFLTDGVKPSTGARALSSFFAVGKDGIVFGGDTAVGVLSLPNNRFTFYNEETQSLLKQELMDTFRRNKMEVQIV